MIIELLFLAVSLIPSDTAKASSRFWIGVGTSYGLIYALPFVSWYEWRTAQGWRLFDDRDEWKQMDKLGHTWATYHLSWMYRLWAESCGYPPRQAQWMGALLGWSFQLSIEVADGFFPKWGASLWDVGWNTIGTGLFLLSTHFKGWQTDIRFSFFPSPYAAQRPDLLGRGLAQILKDYNGQTYWLVILYDKFPFGLALGHGARGLLGGYGKEPAELLRQREYRRWLLSLDPHWEKILNLPAWSIRIFVAIKTPFPALVYERAKIRLAWIYF